MYISLSVHHKESCLRFWYVYIIQRPSRGKLSKVFVCIYDRVFISRKVVESCGMNISSSVHLKKSCLKLRYVYIIKCLSQEKLFKVAVCIYDRVFSTRKVV